METGMADTTIRTQTAVRTLAGAAWLSGTAFLALLLLYFVGLEQGATSVFGSGTHIHEFTHDARHLLGFPCH
jgi:hypothetical protein